MNLKDMLICISPLSYQKLFEHTKVIANLLHVKTVVSNILSNPTILECIMFSHQTFQNYCFLFRLIILFENISSQIYFMVQTNFVSFFLLP